MPIIDDYLREMLSLKGSDLHLSINYPAKYRISGNLKPANDFILTPEFMEKMLKEICLPADRWDSYLQTHDLDFAYEIPGLARFRCNYMYNYYGQAAVLRQIPSKIKSGLVLVTGPTGSGKSTTLAAMIDYINDTMKRHIITIEDPIEFVHKNKNCTIVHREVGIHSKSFPIALRGAMRSDPDIVLFSRPCIPTTPRRRSTESSTHSPRTSRRRSARCLRNVFRRLFRSFSAAKKRADESHVTKSCSGRTVFRTRSAKVR